MDLGQTLVAESGHGHDRVLQVWKVWRSEVGLQRSSKKAEETAKPQPILVGTPEKKEPKHKTVFSYYWAFSKRLGLECYQTWRQELLASLLVALVFYFLSRQNDPAAWVSFKTAGLATAITLGLFAVAHSLRTPWLLHKDISKQEDEDHEPHWGHGLLGVIVIFTIVSSAGLYAAKHLLGPVSSDPASKNQSENATRAGKTELEPSARPVVTPYKEPKNSLRRRTVQLANDLDAFLAERSAKRPSNTEDAKQFDQATINIYVDLYKSRTVGLLQELRARGLDVGLLDAPGAAQSRFLIPDETRQLRDLAYRLDDKGNMVHF
jgi:hypothetical protein